MAENGFCRTGEKEEEIYLIIKIPKSLYELSKRGFLDWFHLKDIKEAIANGRKIIGEKTKTAFDWKENEEKWERFKKELILETHTPITMDYDSSLILMKSAITDTVAKWKTKIEYDIINNLEDLGMELLNALAENKALKEAIEKAKTEIEQTKDEPTDEESKKYNLGLDVAKTIIKKHTKNLIEKG